MRKSIHCIQDSHGIGMQVSVDRLHVHCTLSLTFVRGSEFMLCSSVVMWVFFTSNFFPYTGHQYTSHWVPACGTPLRMRLSSSRSCKHLVSPLCSQTSPSSNTIWKLWNHWTPNINCITRWGTLSPQVVLHMHTHLIHTCFCIYRCDYMFFLHLILSNGTNLTNMAGAEANMSQHNIILEIHVTFKTLIAFEKMWKKVMFLEKGYSLILLRNY